MRKITLNTVQRTSPNYKKYFALVDDEDFDKVSQYNWQVLGGVNCYAKTDINRKSVLMHNFIMGFKGVDHINHNGLDNRRNNLRKVNTQQNAMNMKKHLDGKQRFKSIVRSYNKWYVRIWVDGRLKSAGGFKSDVNAAQAYNFLAEKYYGEYAYYNK